MSKQDKKRLSIIIAILTFTVMSVTIFLSMLIVKGQFQNLNYTNTRAIMLKEIFISILNVRVQTEKFMAIVSGASEFSHVDRQIALSIVDQNRKKSTSTLRTICNNKKLTKSEQDYYCQLLDIVSSTYGNAFIGFNLQQTANTVFRDNYSKFLQIEELIQEINDYETKEVNKITEKTNSIIFIILVVCICISVAGYIMLFVMIRSINLYDKSIKEKTKLQIEKIKHERLHAEMNNIAIQVQKSIFPDQHLGDIGGFNVSAHLESAESVGGDGVDVIPMGDITYVVISDVCGHDFASSILAALFTAIRAIIYSGIKDISIVMRSINRYIYEISQKLCKDKFITFMIFACHDSGKCYYVGSHPDALLYNSTTKKIERIKTDPKPNGTGLWAGIVKDEYFVAKNYAPKEFYMNSGDTLLAYTDGIIEAFSKSSDDVQYGIDDFQKDFLSIIGNDPKTIQKLLIEKLNDDYIVDDDTTLFIARKK